MMLEDVGLSFNLLKIFIQHRATLLAQQCCTMLASFEQVFIILSVSIFQAASCSAEKALSYAWSVVCTNDDGSNSAKTRAESSPSFQLTRNKAALKIDAGSLVGEKTYRFTVVVSLTASPNIATTMSTDVTAEWSPLEAAIAGGL